MPESLKQPMLKCEVCDGTGEIQTVRQIAEDVFVPRFDDDEPEYCQNCEGTGRTTR